MYAIRSSDTVYLSAPPTFDPFILDLMIALRAGATIVLVATAALRLSPHQLVPLLFPPNHHPNRSMHAGITVMPVTPSLLQRCFDDPVHRTLVLHASSSLRLLVIGGESCPTPETLRLWLPAASSSQQLRIIYLYGLTEMSCWSMAYELPSHREFTNATTTLPMAAFPLGALLDNDCEWLLYDRAADCWLAQQPGNAGELVLRSKTRFTYRLLTSESVVAGDDDDQCSGGEDVHPLYTGDIVEIDNNGQLLYRSRADHQIKRFGTRVSVAAIEEVCTRAHLAGVRRSMGVGVRCMWLTDITALAVFVHVDADAIVADIRRKLLQRVRAELPAGCVPDEVYCVTNWPVTKHGKFDWRTVVEDQSQPPGSQRLVDRCVEHITQRFVLDAASLASGCWQERSFMQLGGTSFEAMYLINQLASSQSTAAGQIVNVIGMLLHSAITMREILAKLSQIDNEQQHSSLHIEDKHPTATPAVAHQRWSVNMQKCVDATPTIVTYAGSEFVAIGSHSHLLLTLHASDGSVQSKLQLDDRIEGAVRQLGSSSSRAVVGCYDGCLYAFDFMSGERLWTLRTGGGMIKTRPVWLPNAERLLIGSYVNDETAAAPPSSSNVWCINADNGSVVWKRCLGEKSVYASPMLLNANGIGADDVLLCTLDGTVARFDATDGRVMWRKRFDSPIFATPAVAVERTTDNHTTVILAEVVGLVHCVRAADGAPVWSYRAGGNVFSSLALLGSGNVVVFGCQDAKVYGVDVHVGVLQWCCAMDSSVFARPLVLKRRRQRQRHTTTSTEEEEEGSETVLACSTNGEMVGIDATTGLRRNARRVSGEVFSSPVELRDGSIVFGSRDDWVYCLDGAWLEESDIK